MAINIWKTATSNAFTTTLNSAITSSAETIDLVSTSNLQYPGVLVIDRVDSNNNATPNNREYVSFAGVSGSSVTGCVRGKAGSTNQAHSAGAMVEEVWSTTHWGDFLDTFAESHDSSGKIVTNSWATFDYGMDTNDLIVTRHLYASGASISGFNTPTELSWFVDSAGTPGTRVGGAFPVSRYGTLTHFTAVLSAPASGASLIIDINKNMTSVLGNLRLTIPGGGTYVSTASIATKDFSPGNIFTMDIDASGGVASGLRVFGR